MPSAGPTIPRLFELPAYRKHGLSKPTRHGEWLRAFLLENNIRKPNARWDLSDHALTFLGVHILVRAERHRAPLHPHPTIAAFSNIETQYAAELLREGLVARRSAALLALEEWKSQPAGHPDSSVQIERSSKMIAQIDGGLAMLEELAPILKPAKWCRPPATWRDEAVPLAREFVQHYRKCNPDRRIGLSEDGPVSGFVTVIVPLITGEGPTRNNVTVYLKGYSKEILKEVPRG